MSPVGFSTKWVRILEMWKPGSKRPAVTSIPNAAQGRWNSRIKAEMARVSAPCDAARRTMFGSPGEREVPLSFIPLSHQVETGRGPRNAAA